MIFSSIPSPETKGENKNHIISFSLIFQEVKDSK